MSTIAHLSLGEMLSHVADQPVDAKRIKGLSVSPTLDYAEHTSDVSITHTTEGAADTLVAGNAIALDGATAILVEFFAPAWFNNGNSRTITMIFHDGTSVLGQGYQFLQSGQGNDLSIPTGQYRYTPVAGTYTFSARMYANTGSNVTIRGGAGGTGAYVPMFIRVIRDDIA